ncbi:MAG: hypothetical protein ACYS7Y_04205 [Planctomycetota bacterium]|jgi:hypothetical protein
MQTEIETTIKFLLAKIQGATIGTGNAMQLSQAVLNLSHANNILKEKEGRTIPS